MRKTTSVWSISQLRRMKVVLSATNMSKYLPERTLTKSASTITKITVWICRTVALKTDLFVVSRSAASLSTLFSSSAISNARGYKRWIPHSIVGSADLVCRWEIYWWFLVATKRSLYKEIHTFIQTTVPHIKLLFLGRSMAMYKIRRKNWRRKKRIYRVYTYIYIQLYKLGKNT